MWQGKSAERVFDRVTLLDDLWYSIDISEDAAWWSVQNQHAANALEVTYEEQPAGKAADQIRSWFLTALGGNRDTHSEPSVPGFLWVRRTAAADHPFYFEFIRLLSSER